MRSISSRIVLLIAGAAVAPLLVYGIVSIGSLRRGTEQSVTSGNLAVARQISERIAQYFDNTRRILSSVADQIQGTQLAPWQQERILRNHVLDFPEFRELTMFDSAGKVIATSRATSTRLIPPGGASDDPVYIASPRLDADELQSAIDLASRAGVPIVTVGVGTVAGGPVPDFDPVTGVRRGYKTYSDGAPVESRLTETVLQEIARGTGGTYVRAAEATPDGVAELVRSLPGRGSTEGRDGTPQFAWFASLALLLLALEGVAGRSRDG